MKSEQKKNIHFYIFISSDVPVNSISKTKTELTGLYKCIKLQKKSQIFFNDKEQYCFG